MDKMAISEIYCKIEFYEFLPNLLCWIFPYSCNSCFVILDLKIEDYSSVNTTEEKLINLAILCLELQYVKINSEEVIDKFPETKAIIFTTVTDQYVKTYFFIKKWLKNAYLFCTVKCYFLLIVIK